MRHLLRLGPLFAGIATCAIGTAQPAPPPAIEVAPTPRVRRLSESEIQQLIVRVGSPSYAEREAATNALKRAPEAKAAVAGALTTTTSPEVAQRLNTVLMTLNRDWANKRLARLPEYVKRRQFDRLVETMVACREHLTEEHDKHIRAFIRDVCEAALPDSGGRWLGFQMWDEFDSFTWSNRLGHQGLTRSANLVAREAIPLGGNRTSVAASERIISGLIDGGRSTQFFSCVALCNGEIEVDGIHGGFILATGPVRVRGDLAGAVVMSLTNVEAYSTGECVIVSLGCVPRIDDMKSFAKANAVAFFRNWEMFSARDCGGRLHSLFGVVWADSVISDSAFALAGVRSGDRIDRIDGVPVRIARDAYRLLCRAAVTSGDATVTTIRDGQLRESVVHLQSW